MLLSDNELAMIEQLCYLDNSVASKLGIEGFFKGDKEEYIYEGATIKEILEVFDDNKLKILDDMGNKELPGAYASGKEWSEIIRYMQSNDNISNLVLKDAMYNSEGEALALCFSTEDESNEAIVAFKGTTGGVEWSDNVKGLNIADTPSQKEALDFIESLPYIDITTVGHSKGGNKSMYVRITSDKVKRSVSLDGQGFSQEFIGKYWAEIQMKGNGITNYSLSTDYVNILMFPVPNSKQIHTKGYGVGSIAEHHSPNSFFVTDEFGNLELDVDGKPQIVEIEQDESLKMLHDFTTFLINNGDRRDKKLTEEYL